MLTERTLSQKVQFLTSRKTQNYRNRKVINGLLEVGIAGKAFNIKGNHKGILWDVELVFYTSHI
jgi:hypothetical protein